MKNHVKNLVTGIISNSANQIIRKIIQGTKKLQKSFFLLVLCSIFLPSMQLLGYGFAGTTPVVGKKGVLRPIKEIAADLWYFPRVMSYSFKTYEVMRGKVMAAGCGVTNCYLRLSFEEPRYITDRYGPAFIVHHESDILCSPLQEFYLPQEKKWLPAYQLTPGTVLQSYYHGRKTVLALELVQRALELFVLEVKRRHNLFVGTYGILVHNDAIPWSASLGFSYSWGAGALAGARGGGGAFGIIAGIVVGGIIAHVAGSGETKKIDVSVQPDLLEEILRRQNAETTQQTDRSYKNPHAPEPKKSPDKKPDDDDPDPNKPKKSIPPIPPGTGNNHDDQKADSSSASNNSTKNYKTKEDILAESRLDKVGEDLTQYEKKGTYEDALNDFKSLNTDVIRDIKDPKYPGREGWVGRDGETKITVRNISTTPDKAPTLEFRYKSENTIKIRYRKD